MINNETISKGFKHYLNKHIKSQEKILVLISCGLDSTVLFELISKSNYFKKSNIYYLIFDHQKRPEGKYEIKQFIKYYKLKNQNIFVKKIFFKNKISGFQKESRSSRYNFLYNFSKKNNITNIFLGHHLDDLNETFFMRKIQQSNSAGLSNIFSLEYKGLKLHRPLNKYSKNQIKIYANQKKLIWFEDRSNYELNYTRNKIRHFLYSNKLVSEVNRERLNFTSAIQIHLLYQNFFKRIRNKIFEIEINNFNNLNENLKFLVLQSFYYQHRNLFKKQIRDENIRNFVKILKIKPLNFKKKSVFSGKVGVFNRKICLNLN